MDRSLAVGLGLCGLDRFAGGNPNKKDKKKEDVSTDQQNNSSYKLTIPERDLILQKICQVTTDNNHGPWTVEAAAVCQLLRQQLVRYWPLELNNDITVS